MAGSTSRNKTHQTKRICTQAQASNHTGHLKEVCPSESVPWATRPPSVGPTWAECRLPDIASVATVIALSPAAAPSSVALLSRTAPEAGKGTMDSPGHPQAALSQVGIVL